MKKRKLLILLLGFSTFIISAYSQEVISSSGNYFKNSSGSIAFTIGECVIQTFNGADKILTQGIHQSEIIVIPSFSTGINTPDMDITAFPNPTSDFLLLKVNKPEGLSYILYSLDGKILESKLLNGDITIISFGNLFPATYILRVTDNKNLQIQSFTIIKY